jgi:hypothetical protein
MVVTSQRIANVVQQRANHGPTNSRGRGSSRSGSNV